MRRPGFMTLSMIASVGFCLLAASVQAAVFDLSASIDGFQTVPPTGSSGMGTGLVTYDDSSNLLSWDIAWSDLTGPVTVMHFHGPADVGTNAGVQVNIGGISGTTSPSIGSATITTAQATDLLNDLYYINIHTANFPGGEIRGQVFLVPEPTGITLVVAGIGSAGLVLRRRRSRAGK